jgi:hypothetical protein
VTVPAQEPRPLTDEERAYVLDRLDFVRETIERGAPCVVHNDGPMATYEARRVSHMVFTFFDVDWLATHRARVARRTQC